MIHCPICEEKMVDSIEVCPSCGSPVNKLIKEPEDHGFSFLVVNPMNIPNDC